MAGSTTFKLLFTGDTAGLGKATDDAGGKLAGIGKAAGLAFAAVGAAAVAGAGVSLKAFSDFQSGMNEVFTLIPNAGRETFDQLTQGVKDFSREFGVLPNEVIPALYQSLSAGVPPDNVFSFLETAQKAAKGGVTELETAVDGISSVINAYGTDVLSAAEASDLMFTAVRLGKTDFEQLSSSLFNVVPTAASMGISFDNITAALARLTAQGTPTAVATTQLRQLFVEAAKEGSNFDKALREISGMGFTQLIASGQDVGSILQMVRDVMPDDAFRNLFGSVEAASAALGITGPQAEAFADALDEMGASAGATDKAFQQMEKGLGPAMNRIKAHLAVAAIELGERLAPAAEWVARVLAEHLPRALDFLGRVVDGVIDNIQALVPAFSAVFSTIVGIAERAAREVHSALQWLNPWARHSPSLVEQVESGVDAITAAYERVDEITGIAFDASRSVDELKTSHENLGGALEEAQAKLEGLEGALRSAKEEYDRFARAALLEEVPFDEAAKTLDRQMKELELQVVKLKQQGPLEMEVLTIDEKGNEKKIKVLTATGLQVKALEEQIDSLRLKARQVDLEKDLAIDPLKEAIEELTDTTEYLPFKEIVEGLQASKRKVEELTGQHASQKRVVEDLNVVYDDMEQKIREIEAALSSAGGGGGGGGGGGLSGLGDLFGDLGESAEDSAGKVDTLRDAVFEADQAFLIAGLQAEEAAMKYDGSASLMEQAMGRVAEAGRALAPVLGPAWAEVQAAMEGFSAWVSGTFVPRFGGMSESFRRAGEDVVRFTREHWDQISMIIGGAWEVIRGTLEGMWITISGLIEGGLLLIQGLLDVFFGTLTGDWQRAWDGILAIGEAFWVALSSVVEGNITFITGAFDGMMQMIEGIVRLGWDLIDQHFNAGLTKVKELAGTAWESAKHLGSELMDGLKQGVGDVVAYGKRIVQGLWEGIESLRGWIVQKATEFGKSIFNAVRDGLGKLWPFSPSEAGVDVGEGLLLGIEKGVNNMMPRLEKAVDSVGQAMAGVERAMRAALRKRLGLDDAAVPDAGLTLLTAEQLAAQAADIAQMQYLMDSGNGLGASIGFQGVPTAGHAWDPAHINPWETGGNWIPPGALGNPAGGSYEAWARQRGIVPGAMTKPAPWMNGGPSPGGDIVIHVHGSIIDSADRLKSVILDAIRRELR